MKPLISVIIATHQRPGLLGRALASIRGQGRPEIQIVVVSDSPDAKTYEVASSLLGPDDIFAEHHQQPGPAGSRNLALKLANGEYVMFLDDDDSFASGFFQELIPHLAQGQGKVMYCDPRFIEEQREPTGVKLTGGYELTLGPLSRDQIAVSNRIPNNCMIFPMETIAGREFDPSLILFEDWDFLLNVLVETELHYIPIKGPNIHKNDRSLGERRGARNDDKLLETLLQIYKNWPGRTQEVKVMRKEHIDKTGVALPVDFF